MDPPRRLFNRLVSLGYSQALARETVSVSVEIARGTLSLHECKSSPPEDGKMLDIGVGLEDGFLLHDEVLLPCWKCFAKTLSSAASANGYVIHLFGIELDGSTLGVLLPSFKTAPIKRLAFENNNLGSDGIKFIASVLKANSQIESLHIISNTIMNEQGVVSSFVKNMNAHPKLDTLQLDQCELGQDDKLMSSIVPALMNLKRDRLQDNELDSHAAWLISECLAKNPSIESLELGDNLLNSQT